MRMERREILRLAGMGAALSVLASEKALARACAPPKGVELARLIEAHRCASDAWCSASAAVYACKRGSEARATASAYEAKMHWQEQEALGSLLAYRPIDLGEVQTRMEYLVGPTGPWEGSVPLERELEVLFESMVREAA